MDHTTTGQTPMKRRKSDVITMDGEMKWTCKRCMKKYKTSQAHNVDCTNPQCDVKFDMACVELEFAGANFHPNNKKIECEAVFESPEPQKIVNVTELTPDQWQALLEAGGVFHESEIHGPPV